MKIAFRVDANARIGHGHISRCANLGAKLVSLGADVSFICTDLNDEIKNNLHRLGIAVKSLPSANALSTSYLANSESTHLYDSWLGTSWRDDADSTKTVLEADPSWDWLITDHYGIDERWHRVLRNSVKRIFVVDDLANRRHDCDLLVDQSYFGTDQDRYKGLTPEHCEVYLGPKYVLLSDDFNSPPCKRRNRAISRILVSFGGADALGLSVKVMKELNQFIPEHIYIDLAVGNSNTRKLELQEFSKRERTTVHLHSKSLVHLMRVADLAIGAGGVTALERSFMKLPTLAFVAAENQRKALLEMQTLNLLSLVNSAEDLRRIIEPKLPKIDVAVPDVVKNGCLLIAKILCSQAAGDQ